jgi:hypothetical protein
VSKRGADAAIRRDVKAARDAAVARMRTGKKRSPLERLAQEVISLGMIQAGDCKRINVLVSRMDALEHKQAEENATRGLRAELATGGASVSQLVPGPHGLIALDSEGRTYRLDGDGWHLLPLPKEPG